MSQRKKLIPDFGPLQNVRVLCSGSLVAMPHAANLMADLGAEVINIERPKSGDTHRGLAPFARNKDKKVSASWAQDARNRMSMTMNLNLDIPEIKEIFMSLIKESDIYMENLVWLEKYKIYDKDLLKVNPKLVIVHISGYGRPQFGGDVKICDRASYDMIGQAYSGYLHLNGECEPAPPMLAKPYTNDYVSALTALYGALAAYISAQQTGKGQVVDVAQFEAMARIMSDTIVSYTEAEMIKTRTGTDAAAFQPYGVYKSKDDKWVAIGAFGPGVYSRFIKAIELDIEYYTFNECASSPDAICSKKGLELKEETKQWCMRKTAQQIEKIINDAKVGCSTVMTSEDVINNSHWLDRGDIIEYKDETIGKNIKAFGIVPKFSDTPGMVWRGAPAIGQDNEIVLKNLLGYDNEKIEELKSKELI